jgi:cytochrome c5
VIRLALTAVLTLPLVVSCATSDAERVSLSPTVDPSLQPEALVIPEKPWSDEWLEGEAQRYLTDPGFRRQVLEASLTSHKNIYAMTRLSGYGKDDGGWEMLPAWIPKTRAIDDAFVASLRSGKAVYLDDKASPIWDGEVPTRMADWVALGRRIFHEYPLRSEVFAEHALRTEEVATRVGLMSDSAGSWPGVVAYQTVEGRAEIGITCALCHVSVEKGQAVEGRARREFDYGEMRLSFYRDTGTFISEDLKRRMSSWGPGRADITQDDDEDPVAIVDLWGVRDHEYLTQAGTLRNMHPAALAIRQETQILHANHERIRPPRVVAWALAMYVYSLTPPAREASSEDPKVLSRGKLLFAEGCEHCHIDKNYGGLPIAAEKIGTDPVLAYGKARGTGLYRPAPLLGVAEAAPYLHDGTVATLEDLMDPKRTIPGHRYGVDLPKADRDALVAYLTTL